MGIVDDAQNKAQELAGQGKEAAGDALGDSGLSNEGKADQAQADVKQKVTDAADAVKGKVDEVKSKLTGH